MSHQSLPLDRRRFLHLAGLTGALAALPPLTGAASAHAAHGRADTPPDDV
ncbi:twin-arginine translocation signal domain-containing protein, partial [Streptomyces sp. MCAF7]